MAERRKPTEKEKQQGLSITPTPEIPQDAIDSLARCLYPAIRAYFESDEGKRAYAEWKKRIMKI